MRPRSVIILLVEDHEDSRHAFGQILASLGHRVILAADGREALGFLSTSRPDLVLCDLRMPRMDGFGFMAALHRETNLADIPVVAVTGSVPEIATVNRLRAAGFAGHLTKPLDYDAIVKMLDEFLAGCPPGGEGAAVRRRSRQKS